MSIRNSNVLKSYNYNHRLTYYPYSDEWYRTRVTVKGVRHQGYIHKDDVGHHPNTNVKGIALSSTNVYASTDTNSKVLKSYRQGSVLQYRSYQSGWYTATVYVNGERKTGYINSKDVETSQTNQSSIKGIGTKRPTSVYSIASKDSKVLKSYPQGRILSFRTFTKNWYEATVYVNGERKTGYIHSKDVELLDNKKQESYQGIGLKRPTNVYSLASTQSKVLKSYSQGRILSFRSFTKDWYEATVYVNGVRKTGYIHSRDVEVIDNTTQQAYQGIGLKRPTNVYSLASTQSKVLKSYHQGQVLRYQSFTKNWYKATVYVNGVRKTGYIYAKDVESINSTQQTLHGIAKNQPTRVYTYASKSSKPLKNYKYGHILKFKTFTNNWYEATVYVNGKRRTGYIAKSDVNTNLDSSLQGYAITNRTPVYSKTSRNASVLKTYAKGHLLKYKSYNSNWFIATVYVNGQRETGYIHASDVSPNPLSFRTNALANPTNVYNSKSKNSKVLKSYPYGTSLQLRYHNRSWFEATVYLKGKPNKGYVHINDVGNLPKQTARQEASPPKEEIETSPLPDKPVFEIPILMYHHVGELPRPENNGLYVSAESFKEQMRYLKEQGYTLINFDDLPNIENITKPIIVTFDDGYENNLIAYDILEELQDESFNPKATIFVIGSRVGTNRYLSSDQIKEISDSGIISIQAHTMTHPYLSDKENMDQIVLEKELKEGKSTLEQITGKEINAIAYPYGSYNEEVIEETEKYYDYAVTTVHRIATTSDSPYELPRIRVSYDTTLEQFKNSIGD